MFYIRESRATLEFFHYTLGWLWYTQISNSAHGSRKQGGFAPSLGHVKIGKKKMVAKGA